MDLSDLAAYAEEKYQIREQFKWADFPGFSVLAEPYTGKWAALLMRLHDAETGRDIQRCDIKCGIHTLSEINEPYLTTPFRMKGDKWVGVAIDERTQADVVYRLFDRAVYYGEQRGYTLVLDNTPQQNSAGSYQETALPLSGSSRYSPDPDIPEKILQMMRMYRYGDGSFQQKCKNFYRQGKFMEDYEDDKPWSGSFLHYFPTYHDLSTEQLRGYFTWRSNIRKGNWQPVASSLSYIYIYELLNGIGADSAEDSLRKMKAFEKNYLDTGLGDEEIRRNLRRWMLEFAVINKLPAETAREYADPETLSKDAFLMILRDPKEHGDEEIFNALNAFTGEKLSQSPVITKNEAKGRHLFAEVWRYGSQFYFQNNKNLFVSCFGKENLYHWYPLANAVYYRQDQNTADSEFILTECRKFICRGGMWMEKKFETISFEKKRFLALLHEADRLLRKYLNTGHALKQKPEEAWASPYAEAVIEIDRRKTIEAAKPKINIDLSGLEKIRRDSLQTRDSLLTEEELADEQEAELISSAEIPATSLSTPHDSYIHESNNELVSPLSPLYTQIIQMLLRGESPDAVIREQHLIASVITDSINELLFDEIGDNVLECDGSTITLVEDYKEDIINILGG